MDDYQNILAALPAWADDETLARVLDKYQCGAFEFDLPQGSFTDTIRGVTYHVVPHYATEGGEDILVKLRRIMARELDE